jgi:alanyl-tRNA synthetase
LTNIVDYFQFYCDICAKIGFDLKRNMTERLYLNNSWIIEFRAKVTEISKTDEGFNVILNSSAFYPESGGQLHDIGTLNGKKVKRVLDNEKGDIVHIVDNWDGVIGDEVIGIIDKARRLDNMRKHTGQHILSRALIEIVDAETVSSRLGEIESTIELSKGNIESDILQKAEDLANDIILQNIPVKIDYYGREELATLPIRKIPDREGKFRIVQVGDFDYTACGGTHCERSGEVGLVKIVGQEKLRGHLRIIFLAGRQALNDYIEKHNEITKITAKLTCHFRDLGRSVEKLAEQNSLQRREISFLQGRMSSFEIRELIVSAPEVCGIKAVIARYNNQDMKILKDTAMKLAEQFSVIMALLVDDKVAIAVSPGIKLSASDLAKIIIQKIGGKGGGGQSFAQVGGIPSENSGDLIVSLSEIIAHEANLK